MISITNKQDHYEVLVDALKFHGFKLSKTVNKETVLWIGQTLKQPPHKNYIYWFHNTLKFKPTLDIYLKRGDKIIKNAKAIATYDYNDIPTLKKYFPNSKILFIPFGYTKILETRYKPKYKGEKDIDILFYGTNTTYNNKRRTFINYLRQEGLMVKWLGEKKNTLMMGRKKDEFIARSKIVLSLTQNDPVNGSGNDLARLMPLFANKIFTISEKIGNDEDYIYKELSKYTPMYTTKEELAILCKEYLSKSEEEIKQITQRTYDYVVENLNLYKMLPIEEIRDIYQNNK